MKAFSVPGARCTRVLIGFGLCLLLASPAILLWASKPAQIPSDLAGSRALLELELADARRIEGTALPAAHARNPEFAVFGDLREPKLRPESAADAILTNVGHVRKASVDADLRGVPARLLFTPGEMRGLGNGRGHLIEGLNYVQVDRQGKSVEEAHASIEASGGRIVGHGPNSVVVVYVESGRFAELGANPHVSFGLPFHPAFKTALDTGVRPTIEKARASDRDLRLEVFAVAGVRGLRQDLEQVRGVRGVADYGAGGHGFLVVADYTAVPDIARLKKVMRVQESYEYMTLVGEGAALVQAGSWEDSLGVHPFDDVGVDGGGIDTNADGKRINDGTDTVPPQIVAVTDNGISVDSVAFSESAALAEGAGVGPAHRKVHAIQADVTFGDLGKRTCDGLLFGSHTHGNVVAGAIAGNASQIGFTLTRAGIGGAGEPRNLPVDGVARGARILMQDVADESLCTINSLVDRGGNVVPGPLLDRLNQVICPLSGGTGICGGLTGGAGMAHLAVLPFGVPDNFSNNLFPLSNGTYPQQAADLDVFLYNNRDFMVFTAVGNSGATPGENRVQNFINVVPDFFDGTTANDATAGAKRIQVQPPATAKNVVAVGSHRFDCATFFGGNFDCENIHDPTSSKGPATGQSLRMAPIVDGPGSDIGGNRQGPVGVAAWRSRDNDNVEPVEAQVEEMSYGTSYAAAHVAGAAAIVRDYFAQGFYPTASRVTTNRVPNVSGALVKATLVASANFANQVTTRGEDANEKFLRRTRAMDVGQPAGADIRVMGNSEQGYGRVVLTQVLPLSNWSPNLGISGWTVIPFANNTEYTTAGLLAWDDLATGEPLIDNTLTSVSHKFRLESSTIQKQCRGGASPGSVCTADAECGDGGTCSVLAARNAQMRIGVAWTDVPSPADGTGGPLINDLDLLLEGPGPDNCLEEGDVSPSGATCPAGSNADNDFYDGNIYDGGHNNGITDQWSKRRAGTPATTLHEKRNPQEGIHLSSDRDASGNLPSHLYTGTWRVTVSRGTGGTTPGQITLTGAAGVNEDANGNRRLDAGEDTNGNERLDLPGQAYSLVVSGPVFLAEAPPARGPQAYPASRATFDRIRFGCSDAAVLSIVDITTGAGPARSQASTTFTVVNAAGQVLDTETGVGFSAGATAAATTSAGVPVRVGTTPVPSNGILETDTGQFVSATYAPAGQAAVTARAQVRCTPGLINGSFATADGNAFAEQFAIGNGCDNDESFDAGEVVTYSVALLNRARGDDYRDVVATLTPSGPGAGAIRVLDSPRNIGRLPGGQANGVTFHVFVDPAAIPAAMADRKVTMTLTLDSASKGQVLARQSYAFTHAINSDTETLHYSTDHATGGLEVRDFNRNLFIDQPDTIDPFRLFTLPDEFVRFSSLYEADRVSGLVTNTLGEDLNNNNVLDAGEDLNANGLLDRGILASATGPAADDRAPFHFDNNDSGFFALRHPSSSPSGIDARPTWEYKTTTGLCGFQTRGGSGATAVYGIWHTGDGNPDTPGGTATACDNHALPANPGTQAQAEIIFDVLHSPIIAKVHQAADERGFPYNVEFQRIGANFNMQTNDAFAGGGINIDNNIDEDTVNCLLCARIDTYYLRRYGGWSNVVFRFAGQSFGSGTRAGIDPLSVNPQQRTFGPTTDPDGSLGTKKLTGDETGFTAFTQNTNDDSSSPIPQAEPDYQQYPISPTAPVPGVCDGGTTPGAPCQEDGQCGGTATCRKVIDTVEGPTRNFDGSLVHYEGGFAAPMLNGVASPEFFMFWLPGKAGNRWQIGIGFYSIESTSGTSDYGFGADDVVFEWDESHPKDESQFGDGRLPACQRFDTAGHAAGQQCATIAVDRTNLYDCDEAIEITVVDPKALPATSIQVAVVTETDSIPLSTQRFSVFTPNDKRYTLNLVPGSNGLYKGTVTFGSATDTPNNVFTIPGSDTQFIVSYIDPLCDGDGDRQIAESYFDNVDGDGVPAATDKCPFAYDPGQADTDGDGIGDVCDDCPRVYNPDQVDDDADGVGTACDFDDVDGDGWETARDNCPDVYNPDQAGPATRGTACSSNTLDVDNDGIADRADNCVLAANPDQLDTDRDLLGDACDGDCADTTLALVCSTTAAPCSPVGSACGVGGTCQTAARHPASSACSALDDDADADGVEDDLDTCATVYNPTIIPGTKRQADSDRDGIGDACDDPLTLDDDFDGTPDDLVTFSGSVLCRVVPLARFTVLSTIYKDSDGDRDGFPDTGETGNVAVRLRNDGPSLTNAAFYLTSTDSDVACITQPTVTVPSVPSGGIVDLLDLTSPSAPAGFTFVASNTMETTDQGNPAKVNMCLTVSAIETSGVVSPVCFFLLADLDVPTTAQQVFTLDDDGVTRSGITAEGFDTDKNGDGNITINDMFLRRTGQTTWGGTPGFYQRGSAAGGSDLTLAAVACGGYDDLAAGNSACILDTDYPMDWHVHCPLGTTNCPNLETGTCVGGCTYSTPQQDDKAHNGDNSMHMGAHFDLTDPEFDTTHFRTLQGLVSAPFNLAIIPRAGDLQLSFWHIAALEDDNQVGGGANAGQCADCGDVHFRLDEDPDPGIDRWGFWDKLVPFENVYDHKVIAWSAFSTYYCIFTPTDTGTAPPAPRTPPVHETMCFPFGAWSHCGSSNGGSSAEIYQCAGPGEVDKSGRGVWVETKFNLASFLGQRMQIRWIGNSWVFDGVTSSYVEYGAGWDRSTHEDGWWIDDVTITGTIESQIVPVLDAQSPRPGACPATACDPAAGGDNGITLVVQAVDQQGNVLDGLTRTAANGQTIRIDASSSSIPGKCVNGAPQFQFTKNGAVAQDWSSNAFLQDAPDRTATYSVKARCSTQFACTTANAVSVTVPVYSGDGGDAVFGTAASAVATANGVTYARGVSPTTTLNWWSPGDAAADVYRGTIGAGIAKGLLAGGFWQLNTSGCFLSNVAGTPAPGGGVNGTSGALTQAQDADPAVGTATWYVVSRNAPNGANVNAEGCANPGVCSNAAATFCGSDAQCPAGGTCLSASLSPIPQGLSGCLPNGNPRKVIRSVPPASLCP